MTTKRDGQRIGFHFAALAAAWLLLAGCATETEQVRVAYFTKYQKPEAGHTPQEEALIKRLCLFGEPQHDRRWSHGPTDEIVRPGYVLEHSALDKIPLWVCEHMGPENLGGGLARPKPDPFAPDPRLPAGKRAELKDYSGSHYDRGHQAPSGDETVDVLRQRDTFYLSNMVPQDGQFNQQSWRLLEDKVRNWATNRCDAYVITGSLFYDPKEDDRGTATGVIRHKAIGDHVSVPTHLYKIVVMRGRDDQWHSIAFVMENKKYAGQVDYKAFVRPVRWIEDRSGLNFMPELDKPGNEAIHKRLEQDIPAELWPAEGP